MTGYIPKTGPGSREPVSSGLVLFPLCDKRGWLTSALLGKPGHVSIRHLYKSDADSIFFAWLLDLPAAIDTSAAARAILQVVTDRANSGVSEADIHLVEPDEDKKAFNQRLIHLLQKAVVDKSFYQAETLQSTIDQVLKESESDD